MVSTLSELKRYIGYQMSYSTLTMAAMATITPCGTLTIATTTLHGEYTPHHLLHSHHESTEVLVVETRQMVAMPMVSMPQVGLPLRNDKRRHGRWLRCVAVLILHNHASPIKVSIEAFKGSWILSKMIEKTNGIVTNWRIFDPRHISHPYYDDPYLRL